MFVGVCQFACVCVGLSRFASVTVCVLTCVCAFRFVYAGSDLRVHVGLRVCFRVSVGVCALCSIFIPEIVIMRACLCVLHL